MRDPESTGPKAHILIHGDGVGAPSRDTVVQRARELATIAGRDPNKFTDEDFRQAREELVEGADHRDEAPLDPAIPFEPGNGEILGGEESEARNFASEDETTVAEDLVQEGMDEALHDEMLEASHEEETEDE